jgi:23S rRNA pseudouridine1911/1915/1917 synthase
MSVTQVLREWNGKPLVEVISLAFNLSKKKAKELLDRKKVLVNNKRIWIAKYVVKTGEVIEVVEDKAVSLGSKTSLESVEVLFEDESFLVLNKPAGLLTNGDKSFEKFVQKELKLSQVKAVHRLDRDTSGALIFSKNMKIFELFVELFKAEKIQKKYYALILSQNIKLTLETQIVIETPLEGKSAYTEVVIRKSYPPVYEAEIVIKTGRTHQIRKHLLSRGMQVLGDRDYEIPLGKTPDFRSVGRQMLHARWLAFKHPVTLKDIVIDAPVPPDFIKTKNMLKSKNAAR